MSSNWTWREKVRKEEHLSSMKNLHSEKYLLISRMFLKKWTSKNVIMQNAAVLKKMIKTMKKLTRKNLDNSKINRLIVESSFHTYFLTRSSTRYQCRNSTRILDINLLTRLDIDLESSQNSLTRPDSSSNRIWRQES